jgi:hypothetical protein
VYVSRPIKEGCTTPAGNQGCQIFLGTKYQNRKKYNQITIKYNKRPLTGPSAHKIYQHLPLQDPKKFTQIWIFGLKTNHLATLLATINLWQKI